MNPVAFTSLGVINSADYVKINDAALEKSCREIDVGKINGLIGSSMLVFREYKDWQNLNMCFLFNALNFCYWPEPRWRVHNSKLTNGAEAMFTSLNRAIEESRPIFDANYLQEIEIQAVQDIFRGEGKIPLFEERVNIIREVGRVLKNYYDGQVSNLLESCNFDAMGLVGKIITQFPSFDDRAKYKGRDIYFYKRAQLAAADISWTFNGKSFGNICNLDKLTAFADYKIPQILRHLGILEYHTDLAAKVDNKLELSAGSQEEIEIRSGQIVAIEKMRNTLNKLGQNINSVDLDYWLWIKGQENTKDIKPYHRTITTKY